MTTTRSSDSSYSICAVLDVNYAHDRQRQKVEKAVIGLEKSEAAAAGLIFVCLSETKRQVDLLAEPIPFDRLSKPYCKA